MTAVLMRSELGRSEVQAVVPQVDIPAGRGTNRPRRQYLTCATPWSHADLTRAGTCAVVGSLGLTACWYGSAEQEQWRDQIVYGLGALVATAVVVLGAVDFLVRALRAVRLGIRDLAEDKQRVFAPTEGSAPAVDMGQAALFTGPGMARAHRADCLLLRGKHATPVERGTLAPCGVCCA